MARTNGIIEFGYLFDQNGRARISLEGWLQLEGERSPILSWDLENAVEIDDLVAFLKRDIDRAASDAKLALKRRAAAAKKRGEPIDRLAKS